MKRRYFLLSAFSGLGLALESQYLYIQRTQTFVSCPKVGAKLSQPLLHFVALPDTGFGNNGQYTVAKSMSCYAQANYLVCGAGGKTRPVGHSSWTASSTSKLGFATFDVYSNRLEIREIDTDGKIFDSVGILNSTSVIK